ncbi:esterase [Geomicrobium sp. JCM 19037]|uniref:alpha/beta hydrolase n=1 Tax=Geomicrobium sp. JCM 19037 TaxID=1460634 RepID=UPI00045F1490|nr:alpha/beta hydrolase [Geomicrobium sp. JCM 19037]GAK05852.1 esterase [Geomicrobium sp. JCM 19037]
MESYQSKFFKLVLRLSRRKQFWQKTGEELERGIQTRRLLEFEPPGVIVQELDVEKHEQDGHFYYVIQPKEQTSDLHIFYLHGGAYVNRITSQHWHFLARIVEALGCKITVPLYPLAPEHTFDETYDFVLPIYNEQNRK